MLSEVTAIQATSASSYDVPFSKIVYSPRMSTQSKQELLRRGTSTTFPEKCITKKDSHPRPEIMEALDAFQAPACFELRLA